MLQGLLILLATFWIYSPAFHGGWLWDDRSMLVDNPLMNDPLGMWKIWTHPGVLIDYFPITLSVQRLEWNLFGPHRMGYHLVNVALHGASSLLVWRLLEKLKVRFAWWGGLLFAVHPLMVESVAWMAELKNALALPPLLLAMCFWIDYDERGAKRDYRQALLLFLVAMLCKSSEMMFPVVILLHAWWKRGRAAWSDVQAAAPFFAISLALGFLGAWLQHQNVGPSDFAAAGWASRLATAGRAIFFFLYLFVFPAHLLPIYPSGWVTNPTVIDFVPWLVLGALLGLAWYRRGGWGRHVLLGFGFFLLNIVPVLGYIVMDVTKMNWSVDHLLYLPAIGLIGLVMAGLGAMEGSIPPAPRLAVTVAIASVMVFLALGSHAYAGLYRDGLTLWTYAVAGNPGSYKVRENLGAAYGEAGRYPEAVDQFQQAIKIKPDYAPTHSGLAVTLGLMGRDADSIVEYKTSAGLDPNVADTYYNLGKALMRQHRNPEAIEAMTNAVRVKPDWGAPHFLLGTLLADANRVSEAVAEFDQALQLDPGLGEAHGPLANVLLKANRAPEAIDQYELAIQLDPDNELLRSDLGVALTRAGRMTEAAEQFEAALRINPNDAGAHTNMGTMLAMMGKIPEAIAQYEEALRLDPNSAEARQDLTRAQAIQHSRQGAP